jgi:hypothetical protein
MQLWSYKVALPNSRCIIKRWQISCRYFYIFRKLNSINPINLNLKFCEARSSFLSVKYNFMKTPTQPILDRQIWRAFNHHHHYPKKVGLFKIPNFLSPLDNGTLLKSLLKKIIQNSNVQEMRLINVCNFSLLKKRTVGGLSASWDEKIIRCATV